MSLNDLNDFCNQFEERHYRADGINYYTSASLVSNSNPRGLPPWVNFHYNNGCNLFNGFSIAKPHISGINRNNRENTIIRCSCGSFYSIEPQMWYHRQGNIDLEDIIEDLNYQCQDRANFNMKEQVDNYVKMEISRQRMLEEIDIKYKYKEAQKKKGVNAILGLEVEDK